MTVYRAKKFKNQNKPFSPELSKGHPLRFVEQVTASLANVALRVRHNRPGEMGGATTPLFDPIIESEIFCYRQNMFET